MKILDCWIDEDFKIHLICNRDVEVENARFVISDLHLDCGYHMEKNLNIRKGFGMWVVPMYHKLISIIKSDPRFPGFNIKIYDGNGRLIQTERLPLVNSEPIVSQNFFTPEFDMVGASYVDFFYRDACKGLDFNGTVIDAGGNVGFFTLLSKSRGAKRIYAIEPDPQSYYYLRKNFEHDQNIITINKAVTNQSGSILNFDISIFDSVGSTLSANNTEEFEKTRSYNGRMSNKITTQVIGIGIRDILKVEERIHLLKLDIEGTEFDVIENLNSDDFQKIDQIFLEFHGEPEPLEKKLIQEGYTLEYRDREVHSSVGHIGFIIAKR